jgi:hypothetical protein
MMQNLDLVYALFNQYLFQDAKNNINALEYYFNCNPSTMGNQLVMSLLDSIRKYTLESIDLPLFQSIIMRSGKSPEEGTMIIQEILKYKNFSKAQIAPAKDLLDDICADNLIRKGNNLYKDRPSKFIEYIKQANFVVSQSDNMSTTMFGEVDINRLIAESDPRNGVKTGFELLDNSFEPYRVVEKGSIGIISAQPGAGKSLVMQSMALNIAAQGKHVHMLVLGDLGYLDIITRMCAMYSGKTFGEVRMDLNNIYNSLNQAIGNRLGITVMSANTLDVEEYVNYMLEHKEYEVLFIDYDSNFKIEGADDSLYNAYGKIYGEITKLSKDNRLVFIASQSKVSSWNSPWGIGLADIGESSRKQHTADFVLTISKTPECINQLGMMRLVKNRRGALDESAYIRLDNGHFKLIPKPLHDAIKGFNERKYYTDYEIDQMIASYQSNAEQLAKSIGGNI